MIKTLFTVAAFLMIGFASFSQAPEGFKYQAVVRDAGNLVLNNQAVGMQMTIIQGSPSGTVVYSETFSTTSNAYGLVNIELGSGTTTDDFTTIDWANGPYFIETAIDATGGTNYSVMGTSQLMSVPYSLHANTAENVINDAVDDADNDPTNELQDWSNLPGIPTDIADGDDVNDADSDPTNELQDWSNLPNIPADFADNVDNVDDADNDPTNELQNWSNLPGIPANIDIDATDDFSGDYNDLTNQPTIPTVPNNVSAFTNDAGYLTSFTEVDGSVTNELQTISRTGTTVTLSNGGGTFTDSVGVYTAGTGIDITNNVISTTGGSTLAIGDSYQGGIIFWLDASGQHGLIAATSDQSTGVRWNAGTNGDTRATGDGLYAGEANTSIIIAAQVAIGDDGAAYAAQICNDLQITAGGVSYGDWYLPSRYELNLLYLQRNVVGGFASNGYWSSTENGNFNAYIQNFGSGIQSGNAKNFNYYVRAVRAF